MSDDKTKIGQDRKLISLTQAYELRGWCKSLGCTEAQLRKAVDEVGDSAEKVRIWLKNNK